MISNAAFIYPDRKLDALTALAEELYRTSDTRKNLPNWWSKRNKVNIKGWQIKKNKKTADFIKYQNTFRGIFVVTEFSDSVMKSIISSEASACSIQKIMASATLDRSGVSLLNINSSLFFCLQQKPHKTNNCNINSWLTNWLQVPYDLLNDRRRLSSSSSSDENISSGIPWAKGFNDGGLQIDPPVKINYIRIIQLPVALALLQLNKPLNMRKSSVRHLVAGSPCKTENSFQR